MTIATYREPVRIRSAKELAKMPLSYMQAAIQAQEAFVADISSMGADARSVLESLKGGARLISSGELRIRWKLADEPVPATIVKQLQRRGFLEMSEG